MTEESIPTEPTEAESADPIERLRRSVKPARVVAILRDGGRQELALGGRRAKWDAIRRALAALDWVRLECYDSAGALVDVLEAEEEPEAEAAPAQTTIPPGADREGALVALMIRAQESVLDRIAPILDANARTLQVVTERLERAEARIDLGIERDLAEAQAAREAAAAAPAAAAKSEEEAMQAQLIAAVLPEVVKRLFGGAAPAALPAPPVTPGGGG